MSDQEKVVVFWFRRDLRLDDNTGLLQALKSGYKVLPVFIFDPSILDSLEKDDSRVSFIHRSLENLNIQLKDHHSSIAVYKGTPLSVFKSLLHEYNIQAVYTNRDYEPYAMKRDAEINEFLNSASVEFHTFKDQVIFEKNEIVKEDGTPYIVYTPYMKRWKAILHSGRYNYSPVDGSSLRSYFYKGKDLPWLSLKEIGFQTSDIKVLPFNISPSRINTYEARRNFPGIEGTSGLSPHLRFGTIGIRTVLKKALEEKNETFLNELIWREFYMQILWHFPHTLTRSFKEKYDHIQWRNDEDEFRKWCKGETGYPLVDAGMRQLNKTGYMHNRVRMLVGSFLCKHLLIDWRWGEAYFAQKLLDYEMASNIGNWQWVAGCGVDAAPYFRIFNPDTQIKKFDKDLKYTRTWVEDLEEFSYPSPMVDHKLARERCLAAYKEALL
ncbi:deoxyribodipyrimidine photo-lyase [Leptobacterium flavescens]|uniref:Deoxyribodipyrimidine photo-lyase n=1 Tax=Leptobacterium flavescens TaxID=472055 RepID=A0A6P0ULI2_9FLAO|nr:deoxyribodipyrimidine photo-lyase [Leptobacterium flavescens]NER11913.1 deoxyribodipyrimidine photo-lyase [Leptobacterium flavescens]